MPTFPHGFIHLPAALNRQAQRELLDEIAIVAQQAPFFVPCMPRSGKPFSVRMTNCGSLGWVSDKSGYRYQATHPLTWVPWPPMPALLLALWHRLLPEAPACEACLINVYDKNARMGLHQDRDEIDLSTPVVSVSLGDAARFRVGGSSRGGPTGAVRLESGDVVILGGEARLAFHGIDRIYPGTCDALPGGGRINLTLRRVSGHG